MCHTLLPEECHLRGSLVAAPLACDRSLRLNHTLLLLELVLDGSIIITFSLKYRSASCTVGSHYRCIKQKLYGHGNNVHSRSFQKSNICPKPCIYRIYKHFLYRSFIAYILYFWYNTNVLKVMAHPLKVCCITVRYSVFKERRLH